LLLHAGRAAKPLKNPSNARLAAMFLAAVAIAA